jgi:hypothetical protein
MLGGTQQEVGGYTSLPSAANTPDYHRARAIAVAAGVIEPDQWPESITCNHELKQWQIAW